MREVVEYVVGDAKSSIERAPKPFAGLGGKLTVGNKFDFRLFFCGVRKRYDIFKLNGVKGDIRAVVHPTPPWVFLGSSKASGQGMSDMSGLDDVGVDSRSTATKGVAE